jgi:hypothetical protein
VRSLELKPKRTLTTGTFNLVVKDPIRGPHWAAGPDTTGTARLSPSVLETFQTYRAFDRAVNRCISLINKGAPDLARKLLSPLKTRDMPLRMPWHNFAAHKGTGTY